MQIQVKDYTEQSQTLQNPPEYEIEPLTSEELIFSRLVAKGYSYTQAYRQAFPTAKKLANYTVRKYASELATNKHIATEVESTRQRTAHMTRLAEDRIEDILTNDSSTSKGNKVADVAMFMYEQANGKATQKIEQRSAHVLVTYNLGGVDAPPVPQDILDQLK